MTATCQFSADPTRHAVDDQNLTPPRPNLSDTQLVALSAAARDPDGVIAVPAKLKGAAGLAFGSKLIRLGLADERLAGRTESVWRRDDEAMLSYTLCITAAGLAALGLDDQGPGTPAKSCLDSAPSNELRSIHSQASTMAMGVRGGRQAQLVVMLSRSDGASIDELSAKFGWLAHSARAALTGLRHKGHVIERFSATGADSRKPLTRYRIRTTPDAPAAAEEG